MEVESSVTDSVCQSHISFSESFGHFNSLSLKLFLIFSQVWLPHHQCVTGLDSPRCVQIVSGTMTSLSRDVFECSNWKHLKNFPQLVWLSSLRPSGGTSCLQALLLNHLQSQWRSYREIQNTFQIGPIGKTNIHFHNICLLIFTSLIELVFASFGSQQFLKQYFGDWNQTNQKEEGPREGRREGERTIAHIPKCLI